MRCLATMTQPFARAWICLCPARSRAWAAARPHHHSGNRRSDVAGRGACSSTPCCVHGGVENNSDRTRVSLDFRLMPLPAYERFIASPHSGQHPASVAAISSTAKRSISCSYCEGTEAGWSNSSQCCRPGSGRLIDREEQRPNAIRVDWPDSERRFPADSRWQAQSARSGVPSPPGPSDRPCSRPAGEVFKSSISRSRRSTESRWASTAGSLASVRAATDRPRAALPALRRTPL